MEPEFHRHSTRRGSGLFGSQKHSAASKIAKSLRDLKRQEFRYQPLNPSIDSIRLLVILPRQRGEDMKIIRCRLVHVKFLDNPSYEALSYTWVINNNDHGQDVMDYIYVDGAKVKILPNLYLALRSLREDPYWKLAERTVWADAICIDQENLEERLSQVRLMDFIYSRAIGVVVWLGFPSRPDVCITTEEEFILQNRYWTRLWIIQEIALATQIRVYIGNKSYPNSKSWSWDSFLTTLGPMTPPIIRKLDEKRRDRHGPANQLERLLEAKNLETRSLASWALHMIVKMEALSRTTRGRCWISILI
jgi:hypothetical protein